jgi:hypothetical protein
MVTPLFDDARNNSGPDATTLSLDAPAGCRSWDDAGRDGVVLGTSSKRYEIRSGIRAGILTLWPQNPC